MYSREYQKRSPKVINEKVTKQFIDGSVSEIQKMSHADKITIYFSIMELEAWFLGMYNIFTKINRKLTVQKIENDLGFNLMKVDPQKKFYRPSDQIKKIWGLCNMEYRKTEADIERFASVMHTNDFDTAIENGRCDSFRVFYQEVSSYLN